MSVSEHRAASVAGSAVRVAVISVSDTRTAETDQGGALVEALTRAGGFSVMRRDLIPDEPVLIRERIVALISAAPSAADAPHAPAAASRPDVILLTGGTGVAPRDGTAEAVTPLFVRRLEGFGELFRMLSFAEIGSAAMLSRACAGITAGGVAVFSMPGSPAAIRLALSRLILPELGHLIAELRRPATPGRAGAAHPPAGSNVSAHREHHHHGHDDDHQH